MATAAPAHDPTLNIGTLALNDCRTVCRALKLRAAELRKLVKWCRELDRPTEAAQLEREAQDIQQRLGPKFDEQGTFSFGPGPNEKTPKAPKDGKRGRGRPRDLAEEARDRLARGGK